MEKFTPKFKSKKYRKYHEEHLPFPIFQDKKIIFSAIFTGFTIEITDASHSKLLFDNGCFGKSSKSRSAPNVITKNHSECNTENLVLDLEESFFLCYILKVLTIVDLNGKEITKEEFLEKAISIKNNFCQTLVGYIYLKSKNWIVKSGMKFGGDFLVYKKSLKEYHASFTVVISDGTLQTPKDIQGAQRIAETSNKDILFLEITPPDNKKITKVKQYLDNLDKFLIYEVIVKRFDFKQFVQNK